VDKEELDTGRTGTTVTAMTVCGGQRGLRSHTQDHETSTWALWVTRVGSRVVLWVPGTVRPAVTPAPGPRSSPRWPGADAGCSSVSSCLFVADRILVVYVRWEADPDRSWRSHPAGVSRLNNLGVETNEQC